MNTIERTDLNTITITCACKHCKDFAAEKDLPLPFRAVVNVNMHAAICGTADGRHAMVSKAYQPPFGRMDAMQAKFGPWKALR